MPRILIYAIAIQYCGTRRSDLVQVHINRIVDKIYTELQNLNQYDAETRDEWFSYGAKENGLAGFPRFLDYYRSLT
ncbi:hypothetical protein EBU94_01005, partial [bacterium]|nr:hypothetical protein [bacterium]